MKKHQILFLIISFLIIPPVFAESVIIVNPANPVTEISKKELKNIYRMKQKSLKGGIVHPINLKASNKVREEFSKNILGKSPKKMDAYYLKRALSGKGQPPKVLNSEEEIIKHVANTKDAIGYVSTGDSSVKVITIK